MNIFIKFDYYFYKETMSEVNADIIICHLWIFNFFEEYIFINIINHENLSLEVFKYLQL
jgi:hypothetical protein